MKAQYSHISGTHRNRFLSLILFTACALFAGQVHAQPMITETRPLPEGRHFHGTAVMGNYLYIFGGALESMIEVTDGTNAVVKAEIGADGHLGPWTPATPLPNARCYISNTTIVLNDVVYIIGGSDKRLNGTTYNTALFTRPLPDGTLMPWTTSAPFGDGLNVSTAVSTPGYIHVIGGVDHKRQPATQVWSNALFTDGNLGQWEPGPKLPMPMWYHSAGVAAGRVFVWGGLATGTAQDQVTPIPYVFSCPVLGSGKLGPWRREKQILPNPFYSASSSMAGHYMLSFSPRYQGATLSNDIWWAYAKPEGISPWRKTPTSIPNRLYHAVAPDYRRGNIYIPGGRPTKEDERPTRRVFFFHLSGEARAEAERAWQALQAAHASSVAANMGANTAGDTATTLTYMEESSLPDGAVPGFMTVTDARRVAEQTRKPLALYFNYKDAKPCEEQKEFLRNDHFRSMGEYVAFAWIDTSVYPQMAQQTGVYRVPTWIFYDKAGVERGRQVGVMTSQELAAVLGPLVRQ